MTEWRWHYEEWIGHPARVALRSVRIARRLGWPWTRWMVLLLAALLHDIGKLTGEPFYRLSRRLSPEERAAMQAHTCRGHAWLAHASQTVALVALCHHERWNGSGYPHALHGSEIPPAARIVAVADVYDALTSRRAYKRAWDPDVAARYIRSAAGIEFDPAVVAAFEAAHAAPSHLPERVTLRSAAAMLALIIALMSQFLL